MNGPSGLVFDPDDNLYVVDSLNHRVQKFTKDGKSLGAFGSQGSGEGQLDMPWGICTDREGDVYVADWQNNRVQKFSPNGQFLRQFGGSDVRVGDLDHPSGVAVDSDGDVYVTDWANHRVQVYGPDGSFIATLVGDAQDPSPWTQTYIDANPDIVKARRRANMEPNGGSGVPWQSRLTPTTACSFSKRPATASRSTTRKGTTRSTPSIFNAKQSG